MTSRVRWRVVAPVAAVVVVLAAVAVPVVAGRSGRTAPPPTARHAATAHRSTTTRHSATPPPPPLGSAPRPGTAAFAADVEAARACQAFSVYLADAEAGRIPAAAGRRLVADAGVLLDGARADSKAGRSLPEWSGLASALVAAADDVVHRDASALASDGRDAATYCQAVPADAAAAGGFHRQG